MFTYGFYLHKNLVFHINLLLQFFSSTKQINPSSYANVLWSSKQVRFLVCWQSHMFQIQAGLLIAKLIVAAGDVMRKIRDCVVGVNAEVPQHVSASLIKSSVT